VYSDHEHEGGSSNTYDRIHVHYANGRRGESAQITNLVDVKLVKDQLVIAGQTRDDQVFYGCLGRDLHVGPCAASSSLQRAADRRSLIARYSSIDASELPDRDLLAQQLASLGITGKRKAALVAAAAETTATVRAQRHVTAFLVKAGLVEPAPMPDIVTQPHAAARTYLDDLSSKLGDAACAPTPLTDAERVKATAWVRKQDEKASSIMIAPSGCGPYTWVAWTPNPGDSKSREVLLGRDGATRILGFTSELFTGESMSENAFGHLEKWFSHDGAIVGIAIANQSLWVIADGKAIAQTKGASLAFYRYDDRGEESSNDIFLDGGTLWHATPTGREKLDLALVRDHEARRAAIALLAQSLPSADAKYLGALKLLGADAALVAECKKLP
jgi:hypothetical protein